ncbi:uncharacterized protein LOC106756858 [Vigna radiata var. radiata]|uniref:Uncharacterized protein LOC106756858 n=1 Tax=Vigna radiata var. radiata TaxID=3916 RepID=A0A1S3TMG4_VIGRR|nr:uncharacterized protein LOC106756858 [Vigna radiata var. radiata]
MMEILNLITLPLLLLLTLVTKTESQIKPPLITVAKPPRPLCGSQFALVNYACSRLPFRHGAPPADSPPPPDGEDGDGETHHSHSHHRHNHRHGHGHRHHHQTPEEDNCCRWAKEVDSQCVCELLLRLPPFLVRPVHQYTLNIGDACNITYSCGSPI